MLVFEHPIIGHCNLYIGFEDINQPMSIGIAVVFTALSECLLVRFPFAGSKGFAERILSIASITVALGKLYTALFTRKVTLLSWSVLKVITYVEFIFHHLSNGLLNTSA